MPPWRNHEAADVEHLLEKNQHQAGSHGKNSVKEASAQLAQARAQRKQPPRRQTLLET